MGYPAGVKLWQPEFAPRYAWTAEEYRRRTENVTPPTRAPQEPATPSWSDLVAELRAGRAWRLQASCLGYPVTLFVGDANRRSTDEARAVCAGCPVQAECAAEADRTESIGIWAGTNERERRAARRRSA